MIRRPPRSTLFPYTNALPIYSGRVANPTRIVAAIRGRTLVMALSQSNRRSEDRKSTRLNSSHGYISYAVFCLKKKKKTQLHQRSDITLGTPCRATLDVHCATA